MRQGNLHSVFPTYILTSHSVLQFEYQQAQLEAEVENLSWKVERAEITDRGVSTSINRFYHTLEHRKPDKSEHPRFIYSSSWRL
jgi:hypothetical protein